MKTPLFLVYHQISDLPDSLDPFRISVPPETFAQHMAYLHANNYTSMTLAAVVEKMRAGEPLPPRTVVITFDDGYLDNYTEAFPIMQKYGMTGTIYLVADCVGESAAWDGDIGRQLPLMDWAQIREMRDYGVEFGSHTRTHPALDTLDLETARWEIATSKEVIEAGLGEPITTFAYPYENFNQDIMDMTAESGYLAACGTPRMAEAMFNLWRVEIGKGDTDFNRFKFKVSSVYKPFTQVRRRLQPMKVWVRTNLF